MKRLLIIVLMCLLCQMSLGGDSLIIKASPATAGRTVPTVGIHSIDPNQPMRVQAIPKQGFTFSHWLGNVEDTTSKSTTVIGDGSQVIVAVFNRKEYSFSGGGAASIQFMNIHKDYSDNDFWGYRYHRHWSNHKTPRYCPVPEPATMIILGFGGLMIISKRNK